MWGGEGGGPEWPRATFFSGPSLGFLWLRSLVLHLRLSFSCSVIKRELFWHDWHHMYVWCNYLTNTRFGIGQSEASKSWLWSFCVRKCLLFICIVNYLYSNIFQFSTERPKHPLRNQKPPLRQKQRLWPPHLSHLKTFSMRCISNIWTTNEFGMQKSKYQHLLNILSKTFRSKELMILCSLDSKPSWHRTPL